MRSCDRRSMLKSFALIAVASPILVARELVKPDKPKDLPVLGRGDVLTAEYFGQLVERVNMLSRES